MSTKNIIRTIYLYLFTLVGLALTIIGGVIIVNNILKTYVFKNAEYRYNYYISEPMTFDSKFSLTINSDLKLTKEVLEKIKLKEENSSSNLKQLTEEQLDIINVWLVDYEQWSNSERVRQERESKRDFAKEERDRDMSNALSLIIVGFPIYLFHWLIIVKDIKRNKDFSEI